MKLFNLLTVSGVLLTVAMNPALATIDTPLASPDPQVSGEVVKTSFNPKRVTDINYYISQFNQACSTSKTTPPVNKNCASTVPAIVVPYYPPYSHDLSKDSNYQTDQMSTTGMTADAIITMAAGKIYTLQSALNQMIGVTAPYQATLSNKCCADPNFKEYLHCGTNRQTGTMFIQSVIPGSPQNACTVPGYYLATTITNNPIIPFTP